MRISDWSSDVCSSDLRVEPAQARYITHINAFHTKAAKVPAHTFVEERALAFAPDRSTGIIPLDLSAMMGTDYPLTTPSMLCRYLCIRPGDMLKSAFHATGTVFYVIEGSGHSKGAGTSFDWSAGDAFVRSEEHTSELQSLMRISYTVF